MFQILLKKNKNILNKYKTYHKKIITYKNYMKINNHYVKNY